MSGLLRRWPAIRVFRRRAFALLVAGGVSLLRVASAAPVDFTRDVQPILAEHCLHCHGPDDKDRKAGLRLDVREVALKGGKSELPAIVPGKPDASEIIARITSTDEEEVMPPPKEKKPLNATQKETLRRWIAGGAAYAQHWAFVAPVKAPLPGAARDGETERRRDGETRSSPSLPLSPSPRLSVSSPSPPLPISPSLRLPASPSPPLSVSPSHRLQPNPIDAFVAAKLTSANLQPSPPADATTLCRRLHLDLIGLPPSPQDVDAFVTSASHGLPKAVEALARKLMASERYGERWARVWLDAARYADSNGFEKDLPREQWAWRDWVINAFRRDLPYDQFLIEQIAGDLLPNPTQDQIVATGFLRNGMVNEEGAIVPEQFRVEGLIDRMDCLGKATLGLTLQCAQCHTHKFDPITHDEYYGTFAFLNNSYEAQSWVYTPEQQKLVDKIMTDLRAVDERWKKDQPDWKARLLTWEAELQRARIEWTPVVPTELASTSGLNHPERLHDNSILTLGHPTTKGDIFLIATPDLAGATGLRLEALCHNDLEFGGPGRSKYGTWAVTELEVSTQLPDSDKWEKVALKNATADFSEPVRGLEPEWNAAFDKERRRICGPVAFMIDGSDDTAWRADRGPGRRNTDSVAVVQFEQPLQFPAGTKLKVLLRMNHSGDDNGRHNTMLGRCRVSLTAAPDPKAAPADYAAILAMETPTAERAPQQHAAIFRAWRAGLPEAKKFNTEAENHWKKFPVAATSVLRIAERERDHARPTRLLDRGAWDKPKHPVQPHVPAALHPFNSEGPPNRLAFARWIAEKRSPLTARVAVNRVWQAIFGTGLVDTPEDFGTRTLVPEYRDLLDWLSVDFMENCWSQKHLLLTLVTSHTYQQSSRATPALLERDPGNRLLARGPRFRADAEVVRDIALTVSGLIHQKVGGPSIFPPVPENVLSYNYVKPNYWDVPQGPERYRRSLYLFRKRSMPDPMLSAFDAPNGDFACARRARSNTPLAALTSLNEPVFVEAAQALALRIWREGGATDESRVDYAYRLCTARSPKSAESQSVGRLLADNRDRLRKGELKAGEIAFSAFTKPTELPADATPADLAAWAVVARVMLNLDETLTKN